MAIHISAEQDQENDVPSNPRVLAQSKVPATQDWRTGNDRDSDMQFNNFTCLGAPNASLDTEHI